MDNQATPEELKKLKEDAEREDAERRKSTYEALLSAEKAKRDYEAALDPKKQAAADQSTALKAAKESAEAQTAVSNAQKAQYETELAALKKKFGDFAGSGISGTAEITGVAGSAEATLLGSIAIQKIADKFANHIHSEDPVGSYILVTPSTMPDFHTMTAFEAQYLAMQAAMLEASKSSSTDPAENAGAKIESVAVAAIGAGFEAVNRLLSFVKTDYKFVPLEVSSSDAMLLRALAGKLRRKLVPGNQVELKTVEVPAIYDPGASSATNTILTKAADINKWSIEAKSRIKFYEISTVELKNLLSAHQDDEKLKDELLKAQESLAIWKSVSESLDAWSKQLTTSDDKGNSPIGTIILQSSIKSKLQGADVGLVIIELHKVTGTGYTEKNIWTSLGRNPFEVMGGALASYIMLKGDTGKVLSSLLLPAHSGYHSVSDVEDIVNR